MATRNAAVKKVAAKKAPAKTSVKKVASKKALSKGSAGKAKAEAKVQSLDVDLSFIGSKDEVAETRNIASRERVRCTLDSEVEKFLSGGGQIDSIEANVMGDPPRKPESNYGSRPI